MARILLQQEGVLVNATNDIGESALHWCHSADAVRLLVEHGADLEQCDKSGHTPLMKACSRVTDKNPCRADVIFALLEAGANIQAGLTANPVSVCWNNLGNDIVEVLLKKWGYDLYSPSSTCSPLPWVNLSRSCGDANIANLLSDLPHWGLRVLCSNVIVARDGDGNKDDLKVYVRQFTKMQADTNDAELYRQARLLDYVSPKIVQAQVALTRCKLWLILVQSLPKACTPTTLTESIRNKVGAWAEDCLDMSLDALDALLAPLKREAVALDKLAAEREGRGESCTYARAIGGLIDSIRGDAETIGRIATGTDEDVATVAEDAAIIATLTALGPGDDWARVIGGLQRVFKQTIDPEDKTDAAADLVRLVNRLLVTCCSDFINHPDFRRFKVDDKRDKVREATVRMRVARKHVVDTNREADEDAKRKFPIRGGERKQKMKMNMQRQEYVKKIRDKCQHLFEKEEASIKLEKRVQKYQATLDQLPDLWEHCATQIVDQQKGNGRPIYNTVDLDRMDPSKPGGCVELGDAINAFSSLIASCAHRHATAISHIYVDLSAHVVDESGREEEPASGVLEQLAAGGGEEKGTDRSEVQNDEGAGKMSKGNKKKNTAETDAAEGTSSESIVGGKSTSPQTVKRSEKQKREAREAAEQLAREKSRLERLQKRDREAMERKALEAQWAAEQEIKLKAEQEAKEADPAIAEMCRILKHAIDFTGPGRLELLAEAERALGKSGVKEKVATVLLMEAMLAFAAETKRCKVVVETRRADVERRRIVVSAKQRRNEEAAQRRKVEERAKLLKAEQAALRAEEAALHKEEEALRNDEKKAQFKRMVEERTRLLKAEDVQVQEERRRGGEAQVRKYDEEEARRRKAENDQMYEEMQTDRPPVLEWKTVSASTTLRRVQRSTMLSDHCAGIVIGRRGTNIKQIRLDSGASVIIVDSTTKLGPRAVTVIGSSDQCQVAERMIEQFVDEDLRESGRQNSRNEQRQINENFATKRKKTQFEKDPRVEEEQEAARETTRLAHEKSRLELEQKREQDVAGKCSLDEQLAAEQEAMLKAKREKEAEEEEEKEQRRSAEDEAKNAQMRKDADDAHLSTAEDDAQGRKEAEDARRRVEEEAQKLMREAQKLMEDEFDSSEDEDEFDSSEDEDEFDSSEVEDDSATKASTADSLYLNSPRGDETETKNNGETQLTAQVETRGGEHSVPTTSVARVSRDTVGVAGATGAAGAAGEVGENSSRDDISDGRVSQGFAGPSVSEVCGFLRHAISSRGPDQIHLLTEAATIALQTLTNKLPTFPTTMALAGGVDASADHTARKLRILYIDDSVAACTMACSVFARLGFVADARVGGVKGLDYVCDDNSIPPDMVVLDLDMPHIDGFYLLREIKKNPRWKNVPVFITTSTDPSDPKKEELRQIGAFAVESKPIHPSMLLQITQQALTSAAAAGRVHRKLRLLFVDDSDAVCNAACAIFEPLGFVTEAIRGGIEGLEYVCNEDTVLPHVIVLDLDMPHVTGKSLLRVIKGNKKWQHVAVFILTGTEPTREYQLELLENGARQMMAKPISAAKIVQVVMNGVECANKEEAEERGRAGVGGVEGAIVGAKGGGGSAEKEEAEE